MGEIGPLVGLYLCTMLLTALLSNSASVALMFPIAWQMTGLSIKCRMYVLMFAASGMLNKYKKKIKHPNFYKIEKIYTDFCCS